MYISKKYICYEEDDDSSFFHPPMWMKVKNLQQQQQAIAVAMASSIDRATPTLPMSFFIEPTKPVTILTNKRKRPETSDPDDTGCNTPPHKWHACEGACEDKTDSSGNGYIAESETFEDSQK